MPRAELLRHTVIVLSVRPSVCLSVFYKHFSSLAKNLALKQATQADIDICSDLYLRTLGLKPSFVNYGVIYLPC